MAQDAHQVETGRAPSGRHAGPAPSEAPAEATASHPAAAIDPRIDREDQEALLQPLVRPTQESEGELGFARSLTQHVVDSWNHSAAEEALHDWPEAQTPPSAAPDTEAYRFEDSSAPPLFPRATYFPPAADEPWPDSRAALYDHPA